MTKKELAEAISNHDYFYHMSDDHGVYSSGRRHYQMIHSALNSMFDKKSERCEFWNEHCTNDRSKYTQEYINELIEENN